MSRSVVAEESVGQSTGASRAAEPSSGGGRRKRWLAPLALVTGAVAVLSTALLPLAPVSMSQPVVSWPQSPTEPASTMLQLTAQTPLAIDVQFTCAAARVAGGTSNGVLLATVRPDQPSASGQGLLVTTTAGGLTVDLAGGNLVRDEPVEGDCTYTIAGDAESGVSVSRNGEVLASGEPGRLPAVDVLATSVTSLSPSDGEEISVEVTVDDQFSATPSPLKWTLIALVLIGAVVCVLFLRAEQPGRRRPAVRAGPRRLGVLDVLVPLVMIAWLFLAPMSDDDGYYAAMARNSLDEGAVGNYYQLLNQNFTPFTWFYRLLGVWQVVGDSPVLLRVPALITGLLTWFVLRRFTTQPGALPAVLQRTARGRASLTVLLALVFLAWWLPYGMGVRPEAAVGFLAVATLLAVSAGLRRRSLPLFALAVVAAAMGVVAHPTGFVSLAPLLAGAPRMIAVIRGGVPAGRAWLRGLAVLAPGAVAGVAAFWDGTLNDFQRGQQIFLSIQAQNDWYDEYQRYNFLFSSIPMGSYAKRAAVLLGLTSLVWFAVLAAASRRRGTISPQLQLAAQSLALAFLLLWITPSKWTHHFGAIDGLGPAFLGLFLASLPALVRALPGGLRNGPVVGAAAIGTAVLVFSLSFHGPNTWAYSWLQGVPHAWERPFVSVLAFDSPVLWLAGILVLVAAVRFLHRPLGVPRRRPWLTALPVAAGVFLALTVGYLFGGFLYGAVRTADTYSPWADAVADPAGSTCGPAKAIDVPDVEAGRPLQPAVGVADGGDPGVFASGAGFYPASPPPTAPGTGPATSVWGSLQGDGDGAAVGEFSSPWFDLPGELSDGEQLAVLVSGKLDDQGNELTVEYGRTDGGDVTVVQSAGISDGTQSAVWRTHTLDVPAARAAGADAVRLVAVDGTTGGPGWLAFTGPSVVPTVALSDYLPADAAVATAWQISFLFPCQRQLDLSDGIIEPMQYAVMWGDEGVNGIGDATWQLNRGGLFAPTLRDSSVTLLGGRFRDFPDIRSIQVFRVVAPYDTQAYEVRNDTVSRWGWQGPAEARWAFDGG